MCVTNEDTIPTYQCLDDGRYHKHMKGNDFYVRFAMKEEKCLP